jgi:hypothetical protein
MRQLIFAIFLVAVLPGMLAAQSYSTQPAVAAAPSAQAGSDRPVNGYVFVGPGVSSGNSITFLNYGIGAEGRIKGGFGVAGEIEGFAPGESFRRGFGIASANAGYQFLNASSSGKVVPFVSGGYSLFFASGVDNGINFGGGVNYWFKERVGLRFEIRDHMLVPSPDVHYIGFRFGLTFR